MSRHFLIRALNLCLFTLTTLFCLTVVAPATALAAPKKSVAVGTIEGPQGDATRKKVLAELKSSGDYEITDAEDLRPGSDKGAYAAMAQALQVDAIVVGKISRNRELTLSVIGPDGNLIEDVKLKGGKGGLDKAIDNELTIAVAATLGAKKGKAGKSEEEEEPPPEDEEEAAPPEGSDEESSEDTEPAQEESTSAEESEVGRRPLEFTVAGRLYNRSFVYQDLRLGRVFPYKLAIAPAVVAAARIYPFAFYRDDALANVGIMAKLEVGIATSTNYQEPQPAGAPPVTYQLNNGTSEWQAGLRGRLPFGESELGVFGLYGAHSFILVGDEGTQGTEVRPDPLVPDVDYRFLRFGFDARLRVGALSVGSHFGARFLTSMKNIDQDYWWFPGATGSGIDFGVFAAFQILPFMDLAAGGDYIRYGFDFNNIPDDAGLPGSTAQKIAGGATDTYLSGWFGVILHFGGKAKAEDGSVSVEAKPDEEPAEAPAEPAEEEEPEI
ncbi:MAG TPA: hypothetical protein VFZ53_19090 [Polyangiaceae bacterium]